MFRQLAAELMNLARLQFIVSVVVFFICIVILPQIGFSGMIMKIYPCLAAGYFILFTMYFGMIFFLSTVKSPFRYQLYLNILILYIGKHKIFRNFYFDLYIQSVLFFGIESIQCVYIF